MKTHEELVEMQHKHCIENMKMNIDNRMCDLLKDKRMYEQTLDNMKIAIKSLGHPDLEKYGANDIVSTIFGNIQQLREIQLRIDALEQTRLFLDDEDTSILKG